MTNRYEPRRRTDGPPRATRSIGAHRRIKQRSRAGVLVLALAITVVIGAAGIGLLPRLQSGAPASVHTAAVFETATLEPIKPVVTPKPKPKTSQKATTAVLPPASGSGKRVVFSQSGQRVWLVESSGEVDSTYLVSGSKHPNLNPGTYRVQAHILHATAYDYKSHMDYFVQFTTGQNAAIGFHDIPISNAGKPLQSRSQLGTALSSGCIRQYRADAIRLWDFAPVGTKVVVTA